MFASLSVAVLTSAIISAGGSGGERNYTIRGDGWFDGGNARFGRLTMREARLTLRDNGEFAVTLFVRNERYLVKGRWDRRGRDGVERIDIDNAFGQRASGSGSLRYRFNGSEPQRLELDGRTGEGAFHAEIADERNEEWNDRDDRRNDNALGRGNRLQRDIDVTVDGTGTLRLSGIRDGRLATVRVRMGTNRDMRLEFDRPTRGTVRAEITRVSDNRITARVINIFDNRGSGEIVVVMRDREMVERINGFGSSDAGGWQLDFDGRGRSGGTWDSGDDDGRWGNAGALESTERGEGWLRQDRGPALSFNRMRLALNANRETVIRLEGRRQQLLLRGRWSRTRDVVRVDLSHVNEMRSRGRLEIRMDGRDVRWLEGTGQTDAGRFEVRFDR